MQKISLRQIARVALLTVLALTATSATAQSPQTKQDPAANRPAADPSGQTTNIKIDLTITDQTGPGEPLRKVVTMVLADRGNGSIRSTGNVRAQGRVQINVDASPMILPTGGIRVRLGMEYNPRTIGNDGPTESSSLHEQITVILDPGKPMIVSQAADPASDRKIMVELKASLLR